MEAMVNGIPVHYAPHGSGTPVLALHGGGSTTQVLLVWWSATDTLPRSRRSCWPTRAASTTPSGCSAPAPTLAT